VEQSACAEATKLITIFFNKAMKTMNLESDSAGAPGGEAILPMRYRLTPEVSPAKTG
jgi:hypothetical protein